MKVTQQDQELLKRIGEVLHYIWDPIGVAGIPQARDEYDAYASRVFSLVKKNATQDDIASYLMATCTEHIGLSENRQHDDDTARIILNWAQEIFQEKR